MGYVRAFREEDIHAVAEIHAKTFFGSSKGVTDGLCDYYEQKFFQNPWYDEKYGSVVYCNDNGLTAGFMGRIVRPMRFDDKIVNVAVAHRLMVDPEYASAYAASLLVRKILGGEQDLTLADGSNDNAIKIWKAAGGGVSLLHSMDWYAPLRPAGFGASLISRKSGIPSALTSVALPVARLFDAVFAGICGWNFKRKPPETFDEDIDADGLLQCINQFTAGHRLRPEYEIKTLGWLYDVLKSNKHRGDLRGFVVRRDDGRKLGACVYYYSSKKICEVIFIAAGRLSRDAVLRHLLFRAYSEGAVGVFGRMEPDFLESFWKHNFLVRRGSWALIHGNDKEMMNVICRGEAFISALEGELWLNSPRDRL